MWDAHLDETESAASSSCNSEPQDVHLYHNDHNESHLNCESQSQKPLKNALWERNQEFLRMQTEQLELNRRLTEADQLNEVKSPHHEQQQEPPSETHMVHEQVTEHEKTPS